eukprot:864132-Prymnesium_polylepis.1
MIYVTFTVTAASTVVGVPSSALPCKRDRLLPKPRRRAQLEEALLLERADGCHIARDDGGVGVAEDGEAHDREHVDRALEPPSYTNGRVER